MIVDAVRAYRERISGAPECLADAFDFVLPTNGIDEPGTDMARRLCFESARYLDNTRPPFSQLLPYMLDHGLRQVALGREVLGDPEIRDRLPGWFDERLFSQAALVADVGLAFVPAGEVEAVHEFGPKGLTRYYANHPAYGYGMAEAVGITDLPSETIASFIARHHSVQAKNQYGLEWHAISQRYIHPEQIDLMVAMQKPVDFFDDAIDRNHSGKEAFEARVCRLIQRFNGSFGMLLCANLTLATSMDRHRVDPSLPNRIAAKIQEVVLGETAIGAVYRDLRPDSDLAPSAA